MSLDAIDLAVGATENGPLHALRQLRPEFVAGAQACRLAVLSPANDQGLSQPLRAALAARMARMNDDAALVEQYDALTTSEFEGIAKGAGAQMLQEPEASIVRHVDLVTKTPAIANAADMEKLAQAGLNNPQIVALSELIAFVNFQTRITHGLRLLGLA